MLKTAEKQEVLVRGSAEHKDYLRYQFGRIKDTVNSFETRIAVSGRMMLLLYVVYITVKAGVGNSLPANMPQWVSTALVVLDVAMLAMQVLGLEGSVPGLRHLAEELEDKGKTKEAKTVRGASNIAQWLLVATAIDIVLQRNATGWHLADFANGYTNCLFVLRVVVIGLYLVAMAKLEHKGPKVISAHEAAKQKEEAEQKQTRIDNGNILAAVNQAINEWAKKQPDVNAAFSDSIRRLESIVSQKIESTQQMQNEKIESTQRLVESLQFGSNSANSPASVESILPQVEALVSRLNSELRQSFESGLESVKRQVSQVEIATFAQVRNLQSKVDKVASDAAASREDTVKMPALPKRSTGEHAAASQELPGNVTPIDRKSESGLTKEEVLRLIEADESLVNLSDAALGQKVGSTKSTANRAKREWFLSHPESTQQPETEELEAVIL